MRIYRNFLFHPINFIVAGAALLIVWAELMGGKEDLTSMLWPSVQGNVISSSIQNPTGKWFEVWIYYDYRVDGLAFRDQKTVGRRRGHGKKSLLRGHWNRLKAEKIASRYTDSPTIQVHYDAENPSDSRIRVGPDLEDPRSLFSFGCGILLVFLGIGSWLIWYRD